MYSQIQIQIKLEDANVFEEDESGEHTSQRSPHYVGRELPNAFDLGRDHFSGGSSVPYHCTIVPLYRTIVCGVQVNLFLCGIEVNCLLHKQISDGRLDVELVFIPVLLTFPGSFDAWTKVHLAALEGRIFPERVDEIFSQSRAWHENQTVSCREANEVPEFSLTSGVPVNF